MHTCGRARESMVEGARHIKALGLRDSMHTCGRARESMVEGSASHQGTGVERQHAHLFGRARESMVEGARHIKALGLRDSMHTCGRAHLSPSVSMKSVPSSGGLW